METTAFVIIGAGVQGLTTALLLVAAGARHVHIIAESSIESCVENDSRFASPKAGANWQTFADNANTRLQQYDTATYRALRALATLPQCGIMRLPGFQFFDEKPQGFQDPWYAGFVDGYEHCCDADLPPSKLFGIKYQTVTINVPKYLNWLTNMAKLAGISFVLARLSHWEDVFKYQKADVVINCAGLGSQSLGGIEDSAMYPVRGQILIVRAPQVKRTISTSLSLNGYRGSKAMAEAESKVTYVIPREDGLVILGGTYQQNNYSLEVDEETSRNILNRCITICPELVANGTMPFVVERKVGLRPARKGDCRVEANYTKTSNGAQVLLAQNYGHGGAGYQSSWGCAQSIVSLISEKLCGARDDAALSRFLSATVAGAKL